MQQKCDWNFFLIFSSCVCVCVCVCVREREREREEKKVRIFKLQRLLMIDWIHVQIH